MNGSPLSCLISNLLSPCWCFLSRSGTRHHRPNGLYFPVGHLLQSRKLQMFTLFHFSLCFSAGCFKLSDPLTSYPRSSYTFLSFLSLTIGSCGVTLPTPPWRNRNSVAAGLLTNNIRCKLITSHNLVVRLIFFLNEVGVPWTRLFSNVRLHYDAICILRLRFTVGYISIYLTHESKYSVHVKKINNYDMLLIIWLTNQNQKMQIKYMNTYINK